MDNEEQVQEQVQQPVRLSPEERRAERERKRKRKLLFARLKLAAICAVFVLLIVLIIVLVSKCGSGTPEVATTTALDTTAVITTEAPTEPPVTEAKPDVASLNFSTFDDELVFINAENQIPNTYLIADFVSLKNNIKLSRLCYNTDDVVNAPKFQELIDKMKASDLKPAYVRGYVSEDEQKALFDIKVSEFTADGMPQEAAEEEAAKEVARPGYCEYQSGLDVDLFDADNTNYDETQKDSKVQAWLRENSWQYGFIERYPAEKADITGVAFEPWHYRYVGHKAAAYMHDNNLCLEELIALLNG